MTVSEKLRLVQGLHSHAEIFGFNWDDGSDWTWHDVACKIADEVDVENAKLREQIHWLKQGDILHVLTDQEYIDQCERERLMQVSIDALDKENSKLRELVRDMWRFEQMSCSKCVAKNDGYCGIGIDEECPLEHSIYDRMRGLGVEVDV